MFQDTCCLFDDAPTLVGPRGQNRVELSLSDNDVHLAADSGVTQQLLNVEQPHAFAVDLVFARAVSEHPASDGDLGVVDGQQAIRVVDGENHLGPAERWAARRPGEDDIFHLAAAERLRALLSEHPRDRVDHIALAGTVGPDDGGDSGFEPERRGRGEGLESLERQRLQVHKSPGAAGARSWRSDSFTRH